MMKKCFQVVLFVSAWALVVHAVAAQTFTTLHNFAFTNGTGPLANLISSGTTLYGTTHNYGGGTGGGSGSVFKLNTDGSSFTNLHTFSGIQPEGGTLAGGLVLSGSTLYGTAIFGGSSNSGCVFAIGTNGLGLTNIYSFSVNPYTNSDGANPSTSLVLAGNTLYSTANGGGAHAAGTLFAVNTNGTGFTNLHDFSFATGQYPDRDLLLSGGVLYGTTSVGGAAAVGTIYKMNTNGTGFVDFYDFSSPSDLTNSDGAFPQCNLVLSGQTLYGTASGGGNFGSGTVFAINTDGTGFNVLHHFTATNDATGANLDGAQPLSGLTLVGATLYGTTSVGGSNGNGTLFKINTDGSGFATLHHFTTTNNAAGTNNDGAYPIGALLYSGGALYGTASAGGTFGYGTVFSLSIPPTLTITVIGTNAVITWPAGITGYSLQYTTNLSSGVWISLAGQYSVTNPITGTPKFYRLIH